MPPSNRGPCDRTATVRSVDSIKTARRGRNDDDASTFVSGEKRTHVVLLRSVDTNTHARNRITTRLP